MAKAQVKKAAAGRKEAPKKAVASAAKKKPAAPKKPAPPASRSPKKVVKAAVAKAKAPAKAAAKTVVKAAKAAAKAVKKAAPKVVAKAPAPKISKPKAVPPAKPSGKVAPNAEKVVKAAKPAAKPAPAPKAAAKPALAPKAGAKPAAKPAAAPKAAPAPAPVAAAPKPAPAAEKRTRRPRPRVTSSGAPAASWLTSEKPRAASFIPAPPRAEAPSAIAAPPASSDRLIRPEDLNDVVVRTVPVRIDIEQAAGRFYIIANPQEVTLRAGEGIEWDFRYFGGADVTVEEIVIEFEKPSPFLQQKFATKKPGTARPHRQMSGGVQPAAVGRRVEYTIRALTPFRTDLAVARSAMNVIG